VTFPAASVTKTRDNLVVYFKAYSHRKDVFEDLRISEDALEPLAL
jgi:hypothetical protein